MTKLPEPDTHCFDDDTGLDVWSYSKEQMLQFRRDALEEAMQVCMKMETAIDGGGRAYYRPADARQCVAAIRELKDET
jgi:hypothetical protein